MKDEICYCPSCGAQSLGTKNNHRYSCESCGFQVYHNVAATVSIVLKHGDEILFSQRGREPSKGLLDFPGGFVDPGESLEQALVRELQEELSWQPTSYSYLFSAANTYPYAGVVYRTADAFFLCEPESKPLLRPQDDVQALVWTSLAELNHDLLAFDSMKQAVQTLTDMIGQRV